MTGSSSLVGQTISHYRITERIGAGGTCIGKASSIGTLSRELICNEASFLRRSHAKLCRYFAKLCLPVCCPRMPYGLSRSEHAGTQMESQLPLSFGLPQSLKFDLRSILMPTLKRVALCLLTLLATLVVAGATLADGIGYEVTGT